MSRTGVNEPLSWLYSTDKGSRRLRTSTNDHCCSICKFRRQLDCPPNGFIIFLGGVELRSMSFGRICSTSAISRFRRKTLVTPLNGVNLNYGKSDLFRERLGPRLSRLGHKVNLSQIKLGQGVGALRRSRQHVHSHRARCHAISMTLRPTSRLVARYVWGEARVTSTHESRGML